MTTLPLKDKSILLVEDEIFIAMALEKYLKAAGAGTVLIVTTLEDAQEVMASTALDAAILDIRLPDGHTYGLGEQLLEADVPVVFHSGHADLGDQDKQPDAAFCPKPATEKEVIQSVLRAQEALSARHARQTA